MRLADFERVLERIPRTVRFLNLWHRGEPLCAPEFPEMATSATRRRLWTQTYSNGTLLCKGDMARRLVQAGLKRITLAIDGADEATYQQYRVGGKLADILEGIAILRVERKRAGVHLPKIIVECLIRRQTIDQLQAVKRLANACGADKVKFKTYRVSSLEDVNSAPNDLPDDRRLWRYDLVDGRLQMRRTRDYCRRLAYSAVIAYNGEVFPCCFWTKKFGLGNILGLPAADSPQSAAVGRASLPAENCCRMSPSCSDETAEWGHSAANRAVDFGESTARKGGAQSWRDIAGGPLREFRRIVNSGGRNGIPMCRNCTEGLKQLYVKL